MTVIFGPVQPDCFGRECALCHMVLPAATWRFQPYALTHEIDVIWAAEEMLQCDKCALVTGITGQMVISCRAPT